MDLCILLCMSPSHFSFLRIIHLESSIIFHSNNGSFSLPLYQCSHHWQVEFLLRSDYSHRLPHTLNSALKRGICGAVFLAAAKALYIRIANLDFFFVLFWFFLNYCKLLAW